MKNILLISPDSIFLNSVIIDICEKLNMFYLDIEKAFVYSIGNKEEVKSICGIDYLIKQEKNVINSLCLYENTVATINSQTAVFYDVFDILSETYNIYYLSIKKSILQFLNKKYNKQQKNDINILVESEIKNYIKNKNIKTIKIDSADSLQEDILKEINV